MKEIAQAFVKFQADMKPIAKGNENPFFKSKYADLSSILEAVNPILAKHGLGISQTCRVVEQGTILQTRIIHSSGEEILSETILPYIQDVQKMGSQLSYYKRYFLSAALGVSTCDEDDDGNATKQKPVTNVNKVEKKIGGAGDYVATVGKFKGQAIGTIPPKELTDYCIYIQSGTDKVTGPMKTFIDKSREYLTGAK